LAIARGALIDKRVTPAPPRTHSLSGSLPCGEIFEIPEGDRTKNSFDRHATTLLIRLQLGLVTQDRVQQALLTSMCPL
jgi:hypothetical protein